MYETSCLIIVRYCCAPIILWYTIGSSITFPSYHDRVLTRATSVEQTTSILVFFNKLAINLDFVTYKLMSPLKASTMKWSQQF